MTGYFCEKCNQLNERRQCMKCGKNLPTATYREVWNVVRVPVSDGILWKRVMLILLSVVGILILLSALFCVFSRDMNALIDQGIITVIMALLPVGVLFTVLVLLLQGRENVWYTLANTGAWEQTWHRPSRLHSWSRFETYRSENAYPQPDGSILTMTKERSIYWKDVCRVRFQADKGRILLYHTPHVAPLILRIPAEEYNEAEMLIKKVCKNADQKSV